MEGAKPEHSEYNAGATIPAPAVRHRSVPGLLGGATTQTFLALPCTDAKRQRENGVVPGRAVGGKSFGGNLFLFGAHGFGGGRCLFDL